MSKDYLALIIDDEPDIIELLEITLSRMGVNCRCAENLNEARKLLAAEDFNLCLSDMRLPDGDGIDFVRHIHEVAPQVPVAMITAHGNMETAIEALKAGAFDFISKPVDLKILRSLVNSALKLAEKPKPVQGVVQSILLGNSVLMDKTRKTISKLARSQAPVYISGPSGAGKELAARLIHEQGPRAEQAFVPVNCGAIPPELMESEFFGHKKGSFTGAASDKKGLFQAADGGTLFLDEVADLPLNMQVKLLRAIQEMAVRPVGMQAEVSVNVRVLSATHRDLAQMVESGNFRQDLYYRINVIELPMPWLYQRSEDIPILVEHLLRKIASNWGSAPLRISKPALQALQAYRFPGNVRELENILERAVTLCDGKLIQVDELQLPKPNLDFNDTVVIEQSDSLHNLKQGLDPALNDQERDAIVKALEQTRYNKTAAAKLLGISFRALRYRIKKLGIE
ncbi:Type IV fimbriae expression regulatory protein PilR [hydrothermal vent metagenome]|uniref:Type IV fimbriae expression regulatory protein PilR n=1 Tax=hydrothermal vent metagenome TaxID=652676 RepID=A0A3B1BBI6_9ZZZZ